MKVLIIEDDALVHRALSRLIKRTFRDADVWVADNGRLAMAYLSEPYDLIISDYDLSGDITGGDVLAWLRAHHPEMVARFLFLTSNPIAKALHDRVLPKPSPADDLREEFCRVVQQ